MHSAADWKGEFALAQYRDRQVGVTCRSIMSPARMSQWRIALPLAFSLQANHRPWSWWKDWLEKVKMPFDTAEFDLMTHF